MLRIRVPRAVLHATLSLALTACSGGSTGPTGTGGTATGGATVTSIAISGQTCIDALVTSAYYTATANLSDGSTASITNTSQATWATSNASVLIGGTGGFVGFYHQGEADLRITYKGITGTKHVAVWPAPNGECLTSLTIAGNTAFSSANQTSQLTATATLWDGTTQNVTSQATWASAIPAVATVSNTGLLTAAGPGQSFVSATYALFGSSSPRVATKASTLAVSSLNLTGTFTGPATVVYGAGNTGTTTLVLTQTGSSISGFGTVYYENLFPTAPVLVTGTVGATLTLTLADNAGSCPRSFTLSNVSVTATTITGTYVKQGGCNVTTTISNFALAKH